MKIEIRNKAEEEEETVDDWMLQSTGTMKTQIFIAFVFENVTLKNR